LAPVEGGYLVIGGRGKFCGRARGEQQNAPVNRMYARSLDENKSIAAGESMREDGKIAK